MRFRWQSTHRARRRSEQCEIELTPRRERETERELDETYAILAEPAITALEESLGMPKPPVQYQPPYRQVRDWDDEWRWKDAAGRTVPDEVLEAAHRAEKEAKRECLRQYRRDHLRAYWHPRAVARRTSEAVQTGLLFVGGAVICMAVGAGILYGIGAIVRAFL
jgi:hypothetical protein